MKIAQARKQRIHVYKGHVLGRGYVLVVSGGQVLEPLSKDNSRSTFLSLFKAALYVICI